MFKPVIIQDRKIDVRIPHECMSPLSTTLCCIDANGVYKCTASLTYKVFLTILGNEHNINFLYCSCESLVLTLVRARLWPSTPHHPHIVFSFDLLDWAEALLLECQVALKDLCKAFQFKCPHLVIKVSTQLTTPCALTFFLLRIAKDYIPQ